MKKLISFLCSVFLFPVLAGNGEESSESKSGLTLSSGYFEGQYTNNQLATFGEELLEAGERLEEYSEEHGWPRWWACLLAGYFYGAHRTAYHEIGHALKTKAYGAEYMLSTDTGIKVFEKNENFFKYFVKMLTHPGARGSCSYLKILTNAESLVVAAGGMNNETYLAERQAERLHKNGHLGVVESFFYFINRLSPAAYASKGKSAQDRDKPDTEISDDPIAIEGYYRNLGISAKRSDIKSAGIISTLLSGTTYAILRGTYESFSTGGKYQSKPFELWGLMVPDVFSYTTSNGVSYKLNSGYKIDKLHYLIFGAERVFHGKFANEFFLGVGKNFEESSMSYKTVVTFGKGFDIEAQISYLALDNLSINFGGGSYSCKSLLGERHAKNMKDGKGRSSTVFVSMTLRY